MDATPNEVWLPVVGWEGLYEVSDLGRVRSVSREVAFGGRTRIAPSTVLKGGYSVKGVLFVILSNGKTRKTRTVHQLVLEAFVGPRPEGMEGCHRNDDSDDNRVVNLRWDTHTANMQDKLRNGGDHNANKTQCKWGHDFTPENTRTGRDGGRWCRECHRIEGRKRYHADLENQRIKSRDSMRRRRQAKRESATGP